MIFVKFATLLLINAGRTTKLTLPRHTNHATTSKHTRILTRDPWAVETPRAVASIITEPGQEPFATRARAVRGTWAPYFRGFGAFTFSPADKSWVTHLEPYGEEENYRGLELASIPEMLQRYPDAPWFVLADDDTLVVPHQLVAALAPLDPEQPVMAGKCVVDRSLDVPFTVGGAGMVLSRRLVRDLAPLVAGCRQRFHAVGYGDAMVGACVKCELYGGTCERRKDESLAERKGGTSAAALEKHVLKCLPGFTNDNVTNIDAKFVADRAGQLPATLHIKDTGLFRGVFKSMRASIAAKRNFTWDDVRVAVKAAKQNSFTIALHLPGPPTSLDRDKYLRQCRPVLGTKAQSFWETCM